MHEHLVAKLGVSMIWCIVQTVQLLHVRSCNNAQDSPVIAGEVKKFAMICKRVLIWATLDHHCHPRLYNISDSHGSYAAVSGLVLLVELLT